MNAIQLARSTKASLIAGVITAGVVEVLQEMDVALGTALSNLLMLAVVLVVNHFVPDDLPPKPE